jgi:Lar family restriction alleviation protein
MENRELEYGLQELRECPFCGGEARIATNYAMQQFVVCRKCDGAFWVGKWEDEESVIASWNRRADNGTK